MILHPKATPLRALLRLAHSVSVLAAVSLASPSAWAAAATLDDLRITEVRPDTDEVEVTNISTESLTTSQILFFCHRLIYPSIASGTTWTAGESKVFTLTSLNDTDSDVWLFRDGNFDSTASIIHGVKYGPQAAVGRTNVAVAAGIWPSTSAFVPAPGAGNSIQMIGLDGGDPSLWKGGAPDFLSFFGTGVEILDPLPPIPKGSITIELEVVADNLVSPLGVTEPDDGSGRLFIHDQSGTVHVVDNMGTLLGTPLMDVSARLVSLGIGGPGSFDERGLIGFATHPDFTANPLVYTYTSEPVSAPADHTTGVPATPDNQAVIAEWQMTGGSAASNTVDLGTRREILRVDDPNFNHNGGALHFGPDGFLHIAIGDGGSADDQGAGHVAQGNAQDTSNIFGSILRIDVDMTTGTPASNGQYNIPADNPFAGSPGDVEEIYVYGLRNPYLFSFDQGFFDTTNFRIYVGDAGQNDIEEVDLITAATVGGNYGWRHKEGSFFFDPNGGSPGFVTDTPVGPIPGDVIDPLVEYDHNDGSVTDNGISVVGGAVYRGSAVPELDGVYVFGDFSQSFGVPSGRLWHIAPGNEIQELILGSPERPLDLYLKGFGQDANGEVYVCGSEDIGPFGSSGVVLRIVTVPVSSASAGRLYR